MMLSRTIWRPALAAAALMSLGACAGTMQASSAQPRLASADCFSTTQWQGWSSPAEDVIYLKVRPHKVYRLDLLSAGSRLDSGGRFLISEVHGSTRICSANDMQLWIADDIGFKTPLFPTALTMLTPEDVEKLAPADRP
ncbi:MAG TPA: DUF6491 family protein [Caulobacteraceae bacterium]